MCFRVLAYFLRALDIPSHIVEHLGVCWNDCFQLQMRDLLWICDNV